MTRKNGNGNGHASRLDADQVAELIRQHDGNLASVGRALGVHRGTVMRFVRARSSLQDVTDECRETMKDNAESALYKAVLAGESWAVCFFLKTQAKDRGYVERTELAGPEGTPLFASAAHKRALETDDARDALAALSAAINRASQPGGAGRDPDAEPLADGAPSGTDRPVAAGSSDGEVPPADPADAGPPR